LLLYCGILDGHVSQKNNFATKKGSVGDVMAAILDEN
jgi:hypothetical protein